MLSYVDLIAIRERQPADLIREQLGPSGMTKLASMTIPAPIHSAFRYGPVPIPAGRLIDALGLRDAR